MASALVGSAFDSLPPQVHATTIAIDEVIVTVRKREDVLQDICALVSAVDNNRLRRTVINDVRDLQTTVAEFNDVFPGTCSRRAMPSPCHR